MRRRKLEGSISFSLNGGPEVTLTGDEFDEIAKGKRKPGPITRAQSETLDIFQEFVRGSSRGNAVYTRKP